MAHDYYGVYFIVRGELKSGKVYVISNILFICKNYNMATLNYSRKLLVHLAGLNDLSISHDGKYIITSGSDSFVRIFDFEKFSNEEQDADINQIELHQGAVTCVTAAHTEYFATCSLDCSAILFGSPSTCTYIHHLTRSTLPIRQIAFHPNGQDIAVASDDGTIKILSIQSPADSPLLVTNKQPIYSVSFDPLGRYLASLDKSGSLVLWNAQKNFSSYKTFPAISGTINRQTVANSTSLPLPRVVWSPDGTYIAVPSETQCCVKIINVSTMKETTTVGIGHHRQYICSISWSHINSCFASSSSDGILCIWKFDGISTLISKFVHPEKMEFISSIAWMPSSKTLLCMDSIGQLLQFDHLFPDDLELPAIQVKVDKKSDQVSMTDLFEDSQPSKKQKSKSLKRHEDLSGSDIIEEYYDYDIEDDLEYQAEHSKIAPRIERDADYIFQPPFQPSSTLQYQKSNSSRYFLAYTMTGYIIHRDDGRQTMIDIEFHDKTLYRPIHFVNHYGFTMASMSDRGALFASEMVSNDENAMNRTSTVHYVPFESWAPNSDWTISFDQAIMAIGLSKKWIVTVSDNHYVRIFTFSGIQRWIFCIPGDIVALSIHEDICFFVYHLGTNGKEQKLLYMLYNLQEQNCIVYGDPLPLNKRSLLKWIGFCQDTEICLPVCMDTGGTIRVLKERTWIPVLETSKLRNMNESTETEQIHYWPVALTKNHLICVTVKNDCYPLCIPKPVLTNIPLEIPILQSSINQVNKLEAKLLHDSLFECSDSITRDKILFELIKNAMDQDRLVRALDLYLLLSSDKSLSLAIQLAQMYKLSSLAERMELLRQVCLIID